MVDRDKVFNTSEGERQGEMSVRQTDNPVCEWDDGRLFIDIVAPGELVARCSRSYLLDS